MSPWFDESFRFTVGEEGGFQCREGDRGNWTGGAIGKGELRGTKYGISAAAFPSLNIKDLTIEDAKIIFYTHYWKKAGCDKLAYPLNMIVADNAYHSGVAAALENLKQYPDWKDLIMERIEDMTDIARRRPENRDDILGWITRAKNLYRAASYNEHPVTVSEEG